MGGSLGGAGEDHPVWKSWFLTAIRNEPGRPFCQKSPGPLLQAQTAFGAERVFPANGGFKDIESRPAVGCTSLGLPHAEIALPNFVAASKNSTEVDGEPAALPASVEVVLRVICSGTLLPVVLAAPLPSATPRLGEASLGCTAASAQLPS